MQLYIRLCFAQLYLHNWTPAHARAHTSLHTHTCVHIGGATAHNGPRRIDDPAERVPPAMARRPGRKGGAYPVQRGDRGGVPRADVRVKRRCRVERLRAEPPAVDADGTRSHVSARMRGRPIAHVHAARTDAARGRIRGDADTCTPNICPHMRARHGVWARAHTCSYMHGTRDMYS
jgi:hypothetical protein